VGCVAVFAKPPAPGRVKTRLGRVLGHGVAARLARALLQDSLARWQDAGVSVVIATPEPGADHGVAGHVPHVDQGGGSLGARVERVLRRSLREHPWALAVGADAPALPEAAIQRALAELEAGRTVLGPTEDGGFWALGGCRCPEGLLDGVPWSHASTFQRTLERLRAHGMEPAVLPTGWDVDEVSELARLAEAEALAPRSAALAGAILDAGRRR